MEPELCQSKLTKRWYIVISRNPDGSAKFKHDITEQIEGLREKTFAAREAEVGRLREALQKVVKSCPGHGIRGEDGPEWCFDPQDIVAALADHT